MLVGNLGIVCCSGGGWGRMLSRLMRVVLILFFLLLGRMMFCRGLAARMRMRLRGRILGMGIAMEGIVSSRLLPLELEPEPEQPESPPLLPR